MISKALTAMAFKTFMIYFDAIKNFLKKKEKKKNATQESNERFGYHNRLTF